MSLSNRTRWIIACSAMILLLCGFLLFGRAQTNTLNGQKVSDATPASDNSNQQAGGEPENLNPTQKNSTLGASLRKRDFQVRVGDPLYEPKTQAEADWLNRNGYPSQEALSAATAMPPNKDCLDANDGIQGFEIVCASQLALLRPNERDAAVAFLNRAASDGSIFALEELSQISNHPAINKPVSAEAYRRAAIMRGNWGLDLTGSWVELSQQEDRLASLMAQQIVSNLNAIREKRGLAPLGFDVKPGLSNSMLSAAEQNK